MIHSDMQMPQSCSLLLAILLKLPGVVLLGERIGTIDSITITITITITTIII
jgi:hypothetical protein